MDLKSSEYSVRKAAERWFEQRLIPGGDVFLQRLVNRLDSLQKRKLTEEEIKELRSIATILASVIHKHIFWALQGRKSILKVPQIKEMLEDVIRPPDLDRE